jgi:hypothetical protein
MIPIDVRRPSVAGQAFRIFPIFTALRTYPTGIKGIPDAPAGRNTYPLIGWARNPFAFGTENFDPPHNSPRKFSLTYFSGNAKKVPSTASLVYSSTVSKTRAYLLCSCTLILGAVGGGVATARWYQQYLYRFCADSAAVQVGKDHTALYYFRTGDTNEALQLVEIDLDGQMAVLESMLKEVPRARWDTNDLVILERARAYRQAFPSNGMAGVRE